MNGIINLLKPPGISSNGAVVAVRKLLGVKKVGHTGTLDPGASGVLVICLGKATKLSDYLMQSQKEYIAEITFGMRTDTQDSYGKVLEEKDAEISFEQFKSVLPAFSGRIEQITPCYSAAKQNGEALYKLALKGKAIAEKRRNVEIFEIEAIEQTAKNRFLFRTVCEKGTYIRTLCEDIGAALGVPAYMSMLIRTKTSGFAIEDSVTLDELTALYEGGNIEEVFIPVDKVLDKYEKLLVPEEFRIRLANGNTIYLENMLHHKNGLYRVYCGGVFIGTGNLQDGSVVIDTHLMGD